MHHHLVNQYECLPKHLPYRRMRRGRRYRFRRRLLTEYHRRLNDLIYHVFIIERYFRREEIVLMPNIFRMSLDLLLK